MPDNPFESEIRSLLATLCYVNYVKESAQPLTIAVDVKATEIYIFYFYSATRLGLDTKHGLS